MSGGGQSSLNTSESSGGSRTNVWQPQGDALQNLYGAAENAYGGSGQYTQGINNMIQDLVQQMQGGYQGAQGAQQNLLQGGAVGDTDEIRSELMNSIRQSSSGPSNTSQMYQSIVGGAGNTYIDPVVDALNQSTADNLARQQSGTGLSAAAAGQGGSSRHAMQNAMLGSEAEKNRAAQEASLRSGAYDKDLAMKMGIAQQADQNTQLSQDRLMNLLGQADASRGAGIGYGQNVQNLGMGTMAPWMQGMGAGQSALNNYAGTIGSPIMEGQSYGSGESFGTGFGSSGSMKG